MIYAGVNGYLDPLPVNRVRAFEDGLLSLLRGKPADILDSIRTSQRPVRRTPAAKLQGRRRGLRQVVLLKKPVFDEG